jgi:hypothetical protein
LQRACHDSYMTTNECEIRGTSFTPAARRDFAAMLRGETVSLRYGPYIQLLNAGLIEGPQDAPRLTAEAKS